MTRVEYIFTTGCKSIFGKNVLRHRSEREKKNIYIYTPHEEKSRKRNKRNTSKALLTGSKNRSDF